MFHTPESAVRGWVEPNGGFHKRRSTKWRGGWRSEPIGKRVLVFDTETTTDYTQALLFGFYQLRVDDQLEDEGIIVADDLSTIIHRHPPPDAQGHVSEQVVLPKPGTYTVLADIYPSTGVIPNFQLRYPIHVKGKETSQSLPPFQAVQTVDGYKVDLHGKPNLRVAVQAGAQRCAQRAIVGLEVHRKISKDAHGKLLNLPADLPRHVIDEKAVYPGLILREGHGIGREWTATLEMGVKRITVPGVVIKRWRDLRVDVVREIQTSTDLPGE